jgi:hypothetical protein
MKQIFEEVKTPFKFGIVIRGEDGNAVDCPSIFRYDQRWYMVYVCMNKVGYETHLARSDDLLHWEKLGKVLAFRQTGWDAWQTAGGIALHDHAWGGSGELHTFGNKYWMSYVGGALQGYETDPLAIGMAWTKTPDMALEWTRISENPILSPDQSDSRPFEKVTLARLGSRAFHSLCPLSTWSPQGSDGHWMRNRDEWEGIKPLPRVSIFLSSLKKSANFLSGSSVSWR